MGCGCVRREKLISASSFEKRNGQNELLSATAECVRFEVLNEAGEQAIRGGELHLRATIKSAL